MTMIIAHTVFLVVAEDLFLEFPCSWNSSVKVGFPEDTLPWGREPDSVTFTLTLAGLREG